VSPEILTASRNILKDPERWAVASRSSALTDPEKSAVINRSTATKGLTMQVSQK
jgi:hypothetical protein